MGCNDTSASGMTLAAIVLGLAATEDMTVADQMLLANLLLAAGQAIATRASLLPEGACSRQHYVRIERLEQRQDTAEKRLTETPSV